MLNPQSANFSVSGSLFAYKTFSMAVFFRVKLETFVDFPLEGLNMHKYILDNLVSSRDKSNLKFVLSVLRNGQFLNDKRL